MSEPDFGVSMTAEEESGELSPPASDAQPHELFLTRESGRSKEIPEKLLHPSPERVLLTFQQSFAIQHALSRPPPACSFLELEALSMPYYYVSGDFHYWNMAQEGQECRILLGDSAGHGMAGAAGAIFMSAYLHGAAERLDSLEMLNRINELLFCEDQPATLITCVDLRIDTKGHLSAVNAGHPPVIVLQASGGWRVMNLGGIPLGCEKQSTIPYLSETLRLHPGDMVFAHTDGLYENQDQPGKVFGFRQVAETLDSLRDASLSEIIQGVQREASRFAENGEFCDDVTIVGARFLGSPD